jgi:hypothetical protein
VSSGLEPRHRCWQERRLAAPITPVRIHSHGEPRHFRQIMEYMTAFRRPQVSDIWGSAERHEEQAALRHAPTTCREIVAVASRWKVSTELCWRRTRRNISTCKAIVAEDMNLAGGGGDDLRPSVPAETCRNVPNVTDCRRFPKNLPLPSK